MNQSSGVQAWFAAMNGGQKWAASGNLEEAEKAFRMATRIDPGRMEGWVNLGAVLLERGLFQEAVPALQRARALAPGVGVVHLNLAHAYHLAEQEDEALASCRQAVALSPTPDALNKLGVILRRAGKLAEAETAFRDALSHNGNHPYALVNLATLFLLMGRFYEAGQALGIAEGKALPHEARSELSRARLLLSEWERLDPIVRESFPRAELGGFIEAVEKTPASLLVPDPVVTPFLESVIDTAEQVRQTPPETWSLPPDWRWIEAHFSLHRGDTVESYLAARERFKASPGDEGSNATIPYAKAVQWRQGRMLSAALLPWPDVMLRFVHWLMLRGVDDAKYCPGHFKLQPNMVKGVLREKRALPEYVVGTVRHFYRDLLPRVTSAEARAMAVYVMVIKSHCFIDGNGRVARFLINQELEAGGSSPILVPDAMSASLVEGLHTIFRTLDIEPFLKEIQKARAFTREFLERLAEARGNAIEDSR